MIIKTAIIAAAGAAGALMISAPLAHATVDPEECQNFERPIIISDGYDPLHLDTDGDGIACEGNPGEPVKTDLYADLRGTDVPSQPTATKTVTATPSGELADTGSGNVISTHPLRSIAVGVVVVGTGAGVVILVRRKKGSEVHR